MRLLFLAVTLPVHFLLAAVQLLLTLMVVPLRILQGELLNFAHMLSGIAERMD